MLRYLKLIIILIIGSNFGCHFSTAEKALQIAFTADSTAIFISGMDDAGKMRVKEYLQEQQGAESLISVVQLVADDDSTGMEVVYPGALEMKGDSLLFLPGQPFVKGKSYQVETIIGSSFGSTADVLKGDMSRQPKQQTVVLNR